MPGHRYGPLRIFEREFETRVTACYAIVQECRLSLVGLPTRTPHHSSDWCPASVTNRCVHRTIPSTRHIHRVFIPDHRATLCLFFSSLGWRRLVPRPETNGLLACGVAFLFHYAGRYPARFGGCVVSPAMDTVPFCVRAVSILVCRCSIHRVMDGWMGWLYCHVDFLLEALANGC